MFGALLYMARDLDTDNWSKSIWRALKSDAGEDGEDKMA